MCVTLGRDRRPFISVVVGIAIKRETNDDDVLLSYSFIERR